MRSDGHRRAGRVAAGGGLGVPGAGTLAAQLCPPRPCRGEDAQPAQRREPLTRVSPRRRLRPWSGPVPRRRERAPGTMETALRVWVLPRAFTARRAVPWARLAGRAVRHRLLREVRQPPRARGPGGDP